MKHFFTCALIVCSFGIYLTTALTRWCIPLQGVLPERYIYDTDTHDCKGGVLIRKAVIQVPNTTTLEPPKTSTHSAGDGRQPEGLVVGGIPYTGECDGPGDELVCHSILHCGKTSGYQCCGHGKYNPEVQICCIQMWYRFLVHDHAPEKKHVCCGLDVHRRSPDVPCLHPSKNDGLWKAKPVRKLKLADRELCMEHEYITLMKIKEKSETNGRKFYLANLKQLTNENGRLSTGSIVQKNVPIDLNGPKRHLSGKSFLVYSKIDPLNSTLDFYLRPGDIVFKGKNVRSLLRKAKLAQKVCSVINQVNIVTVDRRRRRKSSKNKRQS